MAISLILLIGLTLRPEGRGYRKLSFFIFGILTIELLRTGSRSATGALLGSVLLFILQREGFGRRVKTWLVTGCALMLVVAGAFEIEADRWVAAGNGNLSGRELIVPTAWQMFLEKPFFGWGPVTHLRELGERAYGTPMLDTHNLMLWVLTEVGLVGALPFLVGWALCLILAWKARKGRFGMMPFAANVCFFLVNQGNTLHNLKLFWVILAMGAACGTHRVFQEPNGRVRQLAQKYRPIVGTVGVRA